MNKEIYLKETKEVEESIRALNKKKVEIKNAYIEANKPFEVGSRVYSEKEKSFGIVTGFKVNYHDCVIPVAVKEKKNGEPAKISLYIYRTEEVVLAPKK